MVGRNGKSATKTVTRRVRTRPEPKPYAGGRVFHVYPPDYKGNENRAGLPDASGIAYNYYCGSGDTVTMTSKLKPAISFWCMRAFTSTIRNTTPGDQFDQCDYSLRGNLLFDRQRRSEKPHSLSRREMEKRSFDGNGNFNLFSNKSANYNYFEGVTIRNTDIAIWAGTQFIAGSKASP